MNGNKLIKPINVICTIMNDRKCDHYFTNNYKISMMYLD